MQTSVLTLTEVLVKPIRLGHKKIASEYEQILKSSPNIELCDIDTNISKKAAKLRAKHALKTPDAIQLATGIEKNADYFFTNDFRLKKVSEIKILTLNDL
jgi:predicted nucleic acid-binding protein